MPPRRRGGGGCGVAPPPPPPPPPRPTTRAYVELVRLLTDLQDGRPGDRRAALDSIAALIETTGATNAVSVQALAVLDSEITEDVWLQGELLACPRLIRTLFSLRASCDPNSPELVAFGFACSILANLLQSPYVHTALYAACPDVAAFADSLADAVGVLLNARHDRAAPLQLLGIDNYLLKAIVGGMAGQDPASSLDRLHAIAAVRMLEWLVNSAPAAGRACLSAHRAQLLPALIGAVASAGDAPPERRRGPCNLANNIATGAALSVLLAFLEPRASPSAAKRATADALLAARPGLLQALEGLPDWREAHAEPPPGRMLTTEMAVVAVELCGALADAGAHWQVLSSRRLMASLLQILGGAKAGDELERAGRVLTIIIAATTGSQALDGPDLSARAGALYRLVGPEAVRALVAAVCTLGDSAAGGLAAPQLRPSGELPAEVHITGAALSTLSMMIRGDPAALAPLAAAAAQAPAFMPLLARLAQMPAAAGDSGGEGARSTAFAAVGLADWVADRLPAVRAASALLLIECICEHHVRQGTGNSQALRSALAAPALAAAVAGAIAAGGGPESSPVDGQVFYCASGIVHVALSPGAGAAGAAFCRAVIAAAPRAPALIAAAAAAIERRGGGGGSGGGSTDAVAAFKPGEWGEALRWLKPLGERLAALQREQEEEAEVAAAKAAAVAAAAAAAAAAQPAACAAPSSVQRVCSVCSATAARGERLFRCARCRAPGLFYCGPRCQAADWRAHKAACAASQAGRQG
ncbi:hypothetical protein Rsub_08387 [Raphidocelis subcapitata]|uniref:MYND-type domain-containing protein n=1 Tax=Raphidocelis subcapitata TaxID=307507 RepID=A0A2V0PEA4_9CHLO|nr:hypothetical protein Rsub_08387 [Raphidocelis subcapitata]|eukprot:GBF95425.1 hypothetical protein Rsub_08387 [Raphidocelis subcapitata]